MQLVHNQRTLEQNRQFHWVISPSMFVRLSTGKVELQHECISDVMDSMGDIPMLDMGMPKPKGEWLASASLFAPQGSEIQAAQASIEIAEKKKTLNVFGDRHWQASLPSSPASFTCMPLDYQHAFGSPEFSMNPNGIGFNSEHLPNVETPHDTITHKNGQYTPASFSPLDPSWPQRAQFQGTYDKQYMEKFFPGYPKDMDWRLFMNAPQDQWIDDFFQGNETFELTNLAPYKKSIKGQLPGFNPRCFIKDSKETIESQFKEVGLHLDTVWFFPDKDLVQLIWRGGMQVASDEAEQISHVLLAYEHSEHPRRDAEHYRHAMEERIQNKDPLQDSLNTQDLIPIGDPSAMQLLQKSAMENIQENSFVENMKTKADTIKSAVDDKIESSLQDLKQQFDNSVIDTQQKNDLLAKLDSLNTPAENDPATDALMKKLDDILPGINSDNSKDIDLSDFSFKKLDELFAEIASFTDTKKSVAFDTIKPEIDKLTKQLESTDIQNNLSAEQRALIEDQLKLLKSIGNEDTPALVALPRINVEALKQQVNTTTPEIQKAQQELHLMLSNPMLRDNQKIQQARDTLSSLQDNELVKINNELDQAQTQFKKSYGMGAHFTDHGLSPHTNDEQQRNRLLTIASGDKDASSQDWACLDLSMQNLDGMNFENCFMEQVNLTGASLVGANFTGAILARANFENSNCSQAIFEQANLGASRCHNTKFDEAQFKNSILSKAEFKNSSFTAASIDEPEVFEISLTDCNFNNSTIKGLPFLELVMNNISFKYAQLETCNFVNSTLNGCNFDHAILPSTAWANTSISNSTFDSADMTSNCFVSSDDDAPCTFDNLDFSNATLNKANLQNLELERVQFSGCALDSANLAGANLAGAVFDDAIGKQVIFRKANLNGASLKRANFMEGIMAKSIITDANLENSNLYGVDFVRATIKGTRFHGANLDATILRDWRPS
jgi:uncharacterized protein YjbI with pentapeptide repeats